MAAPTPPTVQLGVRPDPQDTEQRLLFKIASLLASGLGTAGVDIVTDTSTKTGNWWIFHALTDVVVESATYKTGYSTGSLAGQTVKAGDRIYGPFISFKLTSGSGELYRSAVTP
jgi:hypothetical protein